MLTSFSFFSACLLLVRSAFASPAGIARWVTGEARWGTLTVAPPRAHLETGQAGEQDSPSRVLNEWSGLSASVLPLAASKEHNGRIFFYLMHEITMEGVALTISQASFEPRLFDIAGCGDESSAVDAQDPRCAKATFMGKVVPCDAECEEIAKEALFATHPAMEHWPDNHDFHAHELILDSVWMISGFGGGNEISSEEYYKAGESSHQIDEGQSVDPPSESSSLTMPDWNNTVARSRWITHHSRWGTISTMHHDDHEGQYFGNIRSVTDGPYCESSSGRPIFQFPDADPSARDLSRTDNMIAISFSEASISARNSATGVPCGGEDAGSPTCGQLILYGHAEPLDSSSWKYKNALRWFRETHPLAPWLSKGGSHMQGKYYTIAIRKILILDYFGGYKEVSVGDYLQYDMSYHIGHYCQGYSSSDDSHSDHSMSGLESSKDVSYPVLYAGLFCLAVAVFVLAKDRWGSDRTTKQPTYNAVGSGEAC